MKRALFIASQPFLEWRGSPIRLGFDVQALAELGYAVDFLTLPLGQRREVPGVHVIRAPNLFRARRIAIGPSFLKLAFDAVLLAMALGRVLTRRYVVVHGVEDAAMVAWIAARAGRAGFVYEKHSDPSSYHRGKWRNRAMAAWGAVERFLMRRADATIGTGPGLVDQARALGRGSRACLIPDIPSSLAEATPEGIATARARCRRRSDDVLIAYVGSFAVYQGIDLLFAAIPLVAAAEPRARFVIVGGTAAEIAARRAALGPHAEAVFFAGLIPPDQLPDTLAAADVVLSPRLSGVNTPLKLLDYLKSGAAIVATDVPANRLILTPELAQLTAPDPAAFAQGILALCRDPDRRQRLASRGAEVLQSQHSYAVFRDGLRNCYAYVETTRG